MNKLISATAMALLLAAPTQAAPFTQIDLPSEADAVQWAQKAPAGGESLIEVRSGYRVPGMMMMSN